MKRLLMAACLPALLVCHTAPPAPPQSLLQALSSAQTAVATNGDIPTTCAALSQELSAFSQIARPVMARSDLRNLSMEVAVYGATSDASTSQPSSVARWADLKTRIDRVLAGQKPMEGPRYQIDAPESVRSGMAKVDAALASLGRKPWPGDRTPLTMVLAVQGLGHNDMLSSDGDFDPDMRSALDNTATRYGLTVTLPSLNALAENAVTVESAAKSPAARLTALAERSGGALPLVGSLDWSDADHGWIAHWMLDDGRKRHAWGVKGVSYDEAFRSAVRGAALILSGNGEPEAGL